MKELQDLLSASYCSDKSRYLQPVLGNLGEGRVLDIENSYCQLQLVDKETQSQATQKQLSRNNPKQSPYSKDFNPR